MSIQRRLATSAVLRVTMTVMLALSGLILVGMPAADTTPYSGKAVMCFVDATNLHEEPVEPGKGKFIRTGLVFVWRLESFDNSLMNGWEYTYDNFLLNKQEKGTVSGHLLMHPDIMYDEIEGDYYGRFVENEYSFRTNKAPAGTYTGEGGLAGVTATYEGTRGGEPESCPESDLPPALCEDGTLPNCLPVGQGGVILMNGLIEGY